MKNSSLFAGVAILSLVLGWAAWNHSTARGQRPAHADAKSRPSGTSLAKGTVSALIEKIFAGQIPQPTAEQLKAFVEKKHHSAGSLLAAWHLGGSAAYLEEAAAHYPNNPEVALAEIALNRDKPEEQREWVARLQKNAPNNALGGCYAALDALKDGRTQDAMDALSDAALCPKLDAFEKEAARETTEAYRSAGYEGVEADFLGRASVPVPEAQVVMNLAKELAASTDSDPDAMADLLSITQTLRDNTDGQSLIMQLVGDSAEKKVLNNLDALNTVPGSDVLVADQLTTLDADMATVRQVVAQAVPLISTLTDSELKQYLRRSDVQGEMKALQWVLGRKQAH